MTNYDISKAYQEGFHSVKRIQVDMRIDDTGSLVRDVTIWLSREFNDAAGLILKIEGARDLNIGQIHYPTQIIFTVDDLTGDQLEDIRFRIVAEDPDFGITLYCRSYTARLGAFA